MLLVKNSIPWHIPSIIWHMASPYNDCIQIPGTSGLLPTPHKRGKLGRLKPLSDSTDHPALHEHMGRCRGFPKYFFPPSNSFSGSAWDKPKPVDDSFGNYDTNQYYLGKPHSTKGIHFWRTTSVKDLRWFLCFQPSNFDIFWGKLHWKL